MLAVPTLWKTAEVRVEPADQAEQRTDRSAMPLVLIVVVAVVFLLRVGSEWTMRIFSNVYLDTVLATPTALIGVLFASGQLFGLAALWAPLAISRFGKERTIILGTIGMALAFLPLLLLAHWLAVGAGFIAMIALVSISAPAYGIFSQESVRPEWRTTMSSATMLSLGVGVSIVALGGGRVILNYGYTMLFAIGAMLAVAGAVTFAAYFRSPRAVPTTVALEPVAAEANMD
jgi:predicted MFS family arabinose efflux permease